MGCVLVGYGCGIYYLLPLSLLTMNLTLLLAILFGSLIGMIFGMVTLAFNFQKIFELILVKLLLFWERTSMRILVLKNLVTHKERN